MFNATWDSDSKNPNCFHCENKFTTFLRRHHCRKCGILVCGSCSKGKTFVPEVSRMHSVRICDDCKRRNKGITPSSNGGCRS